MSEDQKQRSDARSNRNRILEAGREILALEPTASLHSIAKAAGVGQGTLYRHFPTREALVLGIYRDGIEALVTLAPTLLREHMPLQAFEIWCRRFTEYGRKKQGIADMVRAAMTEQDFRETYWPIVDAVRQLMHACEQAGVIAVGTEAEDFTQLLGCLLHIAPTTEGEARTSRLLALVFRGLTAGVPS